MRIKLTIEVEIDDTYNSFDEEEQMWMENEVLIGNGTLLLHSNEVGDTVGIVKSVKNIHWFSDWPTIGNSSNQINNDLIIPAVGSQLPVCEHKTTVIRYGIAQCEDCGKPL